MMRCQNTLKIKEMRDYKLCKKRLPQPSDYAVRIARPIVWNTLPSAYVMRLK